MKHVIRGDILIFMVSLIVFSGCSWRNQKFGNAHKGNYLPPEYGELRENINPHGGKHCLKCHSVDENELPELEKSGRGKSVSIGDSYLRTDLNDLCTTCHEEKESDHPVSIVPVINRLDLPLDGNGKINCAVTCHDVHAPDSKWKEGFLRAPAEELCLSCHDV